MALLISWVLPELSDNLSELEWRRNPSLRSNCFNHRLDYTVLEIINFWRILPLGLEPCNSMATEPCELKRGSTDGYELQPDTLGRLKGQAQVASPPDSLPSSYLSLVSLRSSRGQAMVTSSLDSLPSPTSPEFP